MSEPDFLDGLEHDLTEAAGRRRDARRAATVVRLRERLGLRRTVLAAIVFALVGSATAAATFAVLRGSVIPAPSARDVAPEQLPAPGTVHLTDLRAVDPKPGEPPWTLRLARSSTGLVCSTVGQLVGGSFGLIGLDGRFRSYAPDVVDSCGERRGGAHASLVGARVFAASDPAQVRTLVNGVGGPQLRAVTVTARGRRIAVPVGDGGTFVHALAGYPEDSALTVELRFAGGATERHDFGVDRDVVVDPEGGRAWRVEVAGAWSADRDRCVQFEPARAGRPRALSPGVCGRTRRGQPASGAFFAVRRIEPGGGGWRGQFRGEGNWGDQPARTAVWGGFATDVERIDVLEPGGRSHPVALTDRHIFLVVLPGSVDPETLTVRVRLRDGRVEQHRGDTGLVEGRWRG